jgi:hypothetical protein
MGRAWGAIALLAIACGYEPGAYECGVEGLGQVTSDAPISCAGVRRNAVKAFEAIAAQGIVGDWRETPVRFVSTDCLDEAGGLCTEGVTDPLGRITVRRRGDTLAHELLHALDAQKLRPGTQWHQGWDTNGYLAADRAYMSRCEMLDQEPP